MATKIKDVLGMNARNHQYLARYNTTKGKKIANSKLLTKSTLIKHKLPVPRLYRVFRNDNDISKFDFTRLPDNFVIKPNKGLGGEGIIVVESGDPTSGVWSTSQQTSINIEDIKLHIADILEGRFSIDDAPDYAFVEERVRIHPAFEKFAYHGTPDVGVLVFNNVPVMAFLRLPTRESGGRANMFQGAIACGIDIASGTTTYGVRYTDYINFYPGTRIRMGKILSLVIASKFR